MVQARGRLILLVEDDESMRSALQRLLNAFGFDCDVFASAESLLASGPGEGAACVVSDLKLPAMSGLDLLREMRARGGWPPLILITAHDKPGLSEHSLRRGAAAYLPKPFAGTALVQAIYKVLGKGAAQ